jgi:serine/threonine-protein kinase
MTPPEWSRVKEIVGDALERPPEARTAWIEEACGGDVDLRRRVESLLAADARDWDLLDAPAAAVVAVGASQPRLPAPGDRVGPWEILREIGHGGMGAVYLARRADAQFEKTVAI